MLLGRYLIENLQGLSALRYEKAFLFGCIEPDYNYLTYLKGTLKKQLFKGHNFQNSEKCIIQMIEKLRDSDCWRMQEYYCLGKLMHYISDAFTYPHNETYSESIKNHNRYEENLHIYMKNCLIAPNSILQEGGGSSVMDLIHTAHQQYVHAASGFYTDMQFILETTSQVLSLLVPQAEAAMLEPVASAV